MSRKKRSPHTGPVSPVDERSESSTPTTPSNASSNPSDDSANETIKSAGPIVLRTIAVILVNLGTAYLSYHIPSKHLTPLFGSIPSNLHRASASRFAILLASLLTIPPLGNTLPATFRSRFASSHTIDTWLKVFSCGMALVPLAIKPVSRVLGDRLGPEYAPPVILSVLSLVPTCAAAKVTSLTFNQILESFGRKRISIRSKIIISLLTTGILLVANSHAMIAAGTESIPFQSEHIMIALIVISALLSSLTTHSSRPGQPLTITTASPLNLLTWTLLILSLQSLLRRPYAPTKFPITTPDKAFNILSMNDSLTGIVMVAENLKDGFRFMRCDHSLLGGRWMKYRELGEREFREGVSGDSIFSTFVLQEAVRLAYRANPDRSTAPEENALIIGLGVGISAHGLMRHGVNVDIVEIDPAVYFAARTHFGLPEPASYAFEDGNAYVRHHAEVQRVTGSPPKLDYVIHDCFSGGSVPPELFTMEFWADLGTLVKSDGIVAVNFAGVLTGKASQAVLHTLHAAFAQCRAFRDTMGVAHDADGSELSNLVIFCSMAHSPILSFRNVIEADKLRSPLRHHVLPSFTKGEVLLDKYFSAPVMTMPGSQDSSLILHRGAASHLNEWQTPSALATWYAMRAILPFSLWAIY